MQRIRFIRTGLVAMLGLAGFACQDRTTEQRRSAQQQQETHPGVAAAPAQSNEPAGATGAAPTAGTPAGASEDERTAAAASAEIHSAETTSSASPPPTSTANLPPFEGELKVKVAGKGSESIDYAMRGDKIRLGLGPTSTSTKGDATNSKGIDAIIDTNDKKATILLNDRREFAEVDLAKLAATAKKRIENVEVERTGKTSNVSGHSCEEWMIRDRDFRISACVMKGAPYFDLDAIERQASFTAPAWMHEIVDAGYVPLRVNISDASGKSLGSSEVGDTSRKVDPSTFDVPVGYKKVAPSELRSKVPANAPPPESKGGR